MTSCSNAVEKVSSPAVSSTKYQVGTGCLNSILHVRGGANFDALVKLCHSPRRASYPSRSTSH